MCKCRYKYQTDLLTLKINEFECLFYIRTMNCIEETSKDNSKLT